MHSMIGVLRIIISWCGVQCFHLAHLCSDTEHSVLPSIFSSSEQSEVSDIENAKTNCCLCFRLICRLITEKAEIASGALNPVHKDCSYSIIKSWNTLSWE